MPNSLSSRLRYAWNAFFNKDPTEDQIIYRDIGTSYGYRPDRMRFSRGNEKSIVTAILNRIALDASAVAIQHVRLDENGRFVEIIDSKMNDCFSLSANIDQTGRAFFQDVVMSMLDEGCVAIVPVDTTSNPSKGTYDICTMRVGSIQDWFPSHVRLLVYNEIIGRKEEIILPKDVVAIIENPFYSVINEPSSTMQRLIRTLSALDSVNGETSSGKLDMIIQLPYVIKSEARREQAKQRAKDIEDQLTGSKYGVAYTDGTEKVIQLNRSLENNLVSQVEYLTNLLYSHFGITASILDGTADEKTMTNYYNRSIEPILSAITDEMVRKFLTKTARSQRQSIKFFRDPFKLVPITNMADIADKFTRNEIMSSNELRQIVGMKPVDSPEADELRNKNLNAGDNQTFASTNQSDNEKALNSK